MSTGLTVSEVVSESYAVARDHGFWDDVPEGEARPYTLATKLMLIVTEVAEAMEDIRKGNGTLHMTYTEAGKPEGLPSEMADLVIRAADLCGYLGIDLAQAITIKQRYNRTRPYKHGKKV